MTLTFPYKTLITLFFFGLIKHHSAQAMTTDIVLDISDHRIAITSSFSGTSLMLFGAIKGDLRDVDMIVMVRGPEEHLVARRKEQVAGLWINTEAIEFTQIPSFYSVLSTAPLETIVSQSVLERHEIGLNYIQPVTQNPSHTFSQKEVLWFEEAVIRDKQRNNLYVEEEGTISIVSDALFRAEIFFPANVPTGLYSVEVFLLKDKRVVGAQTSPLFVNKTGIERAVFSFAQEEPVWYGIIATFAAALIGLGAAQLFRKT